MEHKYSLLIALILFNYRASVSSALFLDGAPEDRQLFVDMVNSGSLGGTWIQTPTSDPSIFSLNMAAPINFAEANYFGIAMNDYASFSTEATLRVGKNLKGVIIDVLCTSIDSDGNCVFTHNNISNGVQFFDLADLLMLPDDAPETFTRSSVIIHGVAEVIASLNNNITYDSYFGEPSAHRSG